MYKFQASFLIYTSIYLLGSSKISFNIVRKNNVNIVLKKSSKKI